MDGANTIILSSCEMIGNGAVIAAGAVVTKNIPSYGIGGVSAMFVNRRIPEKIRERLEKTQWWYLKEEELSKKKDYFGDIYAFLSSFDSRKK